MDQAHLAKLYRTKEFADCTVVSADGLQFDAHRFILSQYPRMKALLDDNNHIHLGETVEVAQRLMRWMYGLNSWKADDVQPTREGVGKELTEIMGLCDAAQKYGFPKLGDNAYSAVGQTLSQITAPEVGLQVMRDLTEQNTGAGALQRTIIDRVLSLLPRHGAGATKKRKRESTGPREIKAEDEDRDTIPIRSERVKKPTAKAKASPPKQSRKSTQSAPDSLMPSSTKVYCVCENRKILSSYNVRVASAGSIPDALARASMHSRLTNMHVKLHLQEMKSCIASRIWGLLAWTVTMGSLNDRLKTERGAEL